MPVLEAWSFWDSDVDARLYRTAVSSSSYRISVAFIYACMHTSTSTPAYTDAYI